jgi:hypothetical protein
MTVAVLSLEDAFEGILLKLHCGKEVRKSSFEVLTRAFYS